MRATASAEIVRSFIWCLSSTERDYGLYASVAASHKTFVCTPSLPDRSRESSGPGPVGGFPHACSALLRAVGARRACGAAWGGPSRRRPLERTARLT